MPARRHGAAAFCRGSNSQHYSASIRQCQRSLPCTAPFSVAPRPAAAYSTAPVNANDNSLACRSALVTGSGVGIGKATVERLPARGVRGRALQPEPEGGRGHARRHPGAGGQGALLQGDLGDPAACRRVVEEMVDAAGRLDILVNNAGSPIERSRVEDCTLDLWRKVLDVNLTSAFLVTQAAIPHLRAGGHAPS